MLPYHMDGCKVAMRDPSLVTCKFCKQQMKKEELKDHAIAHLVHQKMVERQLVTRVAEQNEFFEDEKLDQEEGNGRTPVLTKEDLNDLPCSNFEVTDRHDDEDVFFKCTVCQTDFEDGERIRTLRCLHMFHKDCIDRWLTT